MTNLLDNYVPCRAPFITGSRAYGMPTEASDLDLVIRVTDGQYAALKALADEESGLRECTNFYPPSSAPLRFGKLNLLCCMTDDRYDQWSRALQKCKQEAPITRDRAIAIHKECRV